MRVEQLVDGLFVDLWSWAQAQADREGIDVADVVNRALDADRRRIEKLPRANPRTIRPGQRGAAAQMRAGEITTTQLAKLTGASMNGRQGAQILRWRRHGWIEPTRDTAAGVNAAWGHADVVACFVLVAFELLVGHRDDRLGLAAHAVRAWHADRQSFRGAYLVIAGPEVLVVGPDFPIGRACPTPTGAVYNLEAIEIELDRRARMPG